MEKYDISFHRDFNHRLVYTEIYKRVSKKTRAVLGEAHDIKLFTDTCSPEFNLESELCKSFQLFVGRLGGKSKNICCIKRNIQFGKAKAFYLHIYMCMSTAIK